MSNTKHTPGPWTNDGRIADYDSRLVVSSNTIDIAVVGAVDPEEEEANARLIAAAPDLLAALQYWFDSRATAEELASRARAAIAKATGTA